MERPASMPLGSFGEPSSSTALLPGQAKAPAALRLFETRRERTHPELLQPPAVAFEQVVRDALRAQVVWQRPRQLRACRKSVSEVTATGSDAS